MDNGNMTGKQFRKKMHKQRQSEAKYSAEKRRERNEFIKKVQS